MELAAGNVAVIGMGSPRAELNTIDPSGQGMARENPRTLADRSAWWRAPLLVLTFIAALAAYAWRRNRNKRDDEPA